MWRILQVFLTRRLNLVQSLRESSWRMSYGQPVRRRIPLTDAQAECEHRVTKKSANGSGRYVHCANPKCKLRLQYHPAGPVANHATP